MNENANYKDRLTVTVTEGTYDAQAQDIAKRLGVDFVSDRSRVETDLFLILGEEGLSLSDGKQEMKGDFTAKHKRLTINNLNQEMLVKAAKIKGEKMPLKLIDATAGMGEDSLILAAFGFKVKLYEYNPVIAELLRDTIRRASRISELKEIVGRMEFVGGDSIEAMKNLAERPDVILLDPMFPERQKSALVKKKFQLLQKLEQPCSDETDLINAAIGAKPRKIIIKRMLKNPYLGGIKPDYSIEGKAIRYDCILNP